MMISQEEENSSINDFFNTFELYYILIITIVGLIGNSISFLMFVFSKLRYYIFLSNIYKLIFINNYLTKIGLKKQI